MQLNYNHLYYFHVAAIEGSVAAAASKLGVTQPTVSEQIRSLERTLGNELFERTATGLKLTESGRLTFELTTRMFRLGEKLVELMGHREEEAQRMLCIGVSSGIARSTTSDFLLPLVGLDGCVPSIRTGDTVELLRELRAGLLDLVLCETEPPEASRRGLETVIIDRMQLLAVAGSDIKPAPDWSDVQLLQYRASSSFRHEVDAFLEAHHYNPRIVAEADDAHVLLEIAARGPYVAIVSQAVAREAVASRRLHVLATLTSNAAVHAFYQDTVASGLARRAVAVLLENVREPVSS